MICARKSDFIVYRPLITLIAFVVFATHTIAATPILQKETLTVEQRMEKARAAIQKKKFIDAENELKQAIKMKEDFSDAYILLAEVYKYQNKKKEALELVNKVINRKIDVLEDHCLLVRLLFENGDKKKATAELTELLKLEPKLSCAYKLKGEMEMTADKHDLALKSLEEYLQMLPPDHEDMQSAKDKIEYLNRYMEVQSAKKDPSYKRPGLDQPAFPDYTEEARKYKVSGVVKIMAQLDTRGEVVRTIIFSRIGYGLDEIAIKTVKRVKFSPVTKDGIPVSAWQPVDIEFNLR